MTAWGAGAVAAWWVEHSGDLGQDVGQGFTGPAVRGKAAVPVAVRLTRK